MGARDGTEQFDAARNKDETEVIIELPQEKIRAASHIVTDIRMSCFSQASRCI